jgi:hypothetical protein
VASPRQGDFAKPDCENEASVRQLTSITNGLSKRRFRTGVTRANYEISCRPDIRAGDE